MKPACVLSVLGINLTFLSSHVHMVTCCSKRYQMYLPENKAPKVQSVLTHEFTSGVHLHVFHLRSQCCAKQSYLGARISYRFYQNPNTSESTQSLKPHQDVSE